MPESNEILHVSYLTELLRGKPIPQFGELLRYLYKIAGWEQKDLEEHARKKYVQLLEERKISPGFLGALYQSEISRAVTGARHAPYAHRYLFLEALKENPAIQKMLTSQIEEDYWTLGCGSSPERVTQAAMRVDALLHPENREKDTDVNMDVVYKTDEPISDSSPNATFQVRNALQEPQH